MFVRLLLFLSIFLPLLIASLSSLQPLCHEDERFALLQFKDSLIINNSTFVSIDPSAYPKVASWALQGGNTTDCCSWDGVACDEKTGHVTGLDLSSSFLCGLINSSSSLFHLLQLQRLNLADNYFNNSQLPLEVGNLSRLTYLNLSYTAFSGQIPSGISHLSKLSSLDLSRNPDLYTQSDMRRLVQNLTSLEELLLSQVNITSPIPESFGNLSLLTTLDLRSCELHGEFPTRILQLPNLRYLNIRGNPNLIGHLPEFHSSSPLKVLDLSFTNFSGELPTSIGNLNSLNHLGIAYCKFLGSIPPSFANLTQLTFLNLSGNSFKSLPSSFGNFTQLTYLALSGNFLKSIPPSFANLTQLTYLDLSGNSFKSIPSSFGNFTQLTYLDLSGNSFNVSPWLTKVSSNNNLPQLRIIRLRDCNLRKFPDILQNQNKLSKLDLSNNNLHGLIPKWIYNVSTETLKSLYLYNNSIIGFEKSPTILPWSNLSYLDLHHNLLQGTFPILPQSIQYLRLANNFLTGFKESLEVPAWPYLEYLDLGNNMLQGSLPIPSPFTYYYRIGHNSITGEISPLFFNLSSLYVLDLSHNYLGGMLPPCLGNFSRVLSVLELQNNSFRGTMPNTWARGSLLTLIDLSQNQLQSQLPRSLVNCTELQYLSVGNNHINDTFPDWLGTLAQLQVLVLHYNAFHGAIRGHQNNYAFPMLQVIDLSHNYFSGNLPSWYFLHWDAMKIVDANQLTYMMSNGSYAVFFSFEIMNKGIELKYEKIQDSLMVIDFSSNRFEGEIPEVVGNLKGLKTINFSNNILTGHIPSCLGNLRNLESLDLSQNNLSGEIPPQLMELNFLELFNVSNNHLIGAIPHGNQFDTFQKSSFGGNPGLCGSPLSKKCGDFNYTPTPPSHNSESPLEFGWKVVAIGYGCGFVIGAIIGQIVITRKYDWFAKISGKMQHTRRMVNWRKS